MKALIVYGTRWGGTVAVAEKMGETLKKEGYVVDVVDVKKNPPEIDPYDLVIVGSGISMGNWTKETQSFLQRNSSGLKGKKTALFVSCGMRMRDEEEAWAKARNDYLIKVAGKYGLTPASYGFFAGVLDFGKNHGLLGNMFVNTSKKKLQEKGVDTSKPYDLRNWDEIENWTREVAQSQVPWTFKESMDMS